MFPTQPAYRFASWAVCLAGLDISWTQNEVIGAGPLPGILQSAYRAELFALLQAVMWAEANNCKIRVWCDCLGVVTRAQKLSHQTWKVPINAANADLWVKLEAAIFKLGPSNFCITKVAAHQNEAQATTSLQSWAWLHNNLVDRAARLANLCRPESFWEFFHIHRAQVEHHVEIGSKVMKVILEISRKAVRREALQAGEHAAGDMGVMERPPPAKTQNATWTFETPRESVPSSVATRFGYRLAAVTKAWLDEGLTMGHQEGRGPQWTSWYQLYIDFQLRTGEIGPIYERTWLDAAERPNLRLRFYRFRKRCAWFAHLGKMLVRFEPYEVHQAVCRPNSVMFALHTASVCVPWHSQRLQDVEEWVGARLPQAATRAGTSLDGLPNAKHLGKWPKLSVSAGPLGI